MLFFINMLQLPWRHRFVFRNRLQSFALQVCRRLNCFHKEIVTRGQSINVIPTKTSVVLDFAFQLWNMYKYSQLKAFARRVKLMSSVDVSEFKKLETLVAYNFKLWKISLLLCSLLLLCSWAKHCFRWSFYHDLVLCFHVQNILCQNKCLTNIIIV